jgi:hypothetical protein
MTTVSDILNKRGSGSGSGISYYSRFYTCARQANLNDQLKALRALEAADGDELESDAVQTGVGFHALMEASLRGDLGGDALFDARPDAFRKPQKLALDTFRAWLATWGSLEDKFGMELLGAEVPLATTVEGEYPLTGRLDFVGYINDAERCAARTGLILPGPGVYVGDWKTTDSASQGAPDFYANSLQAIIYPWLWDLAHPDAALCRGTIFEEVIVTKVPKYRAFFVPAWPPKEAAEIARAFVRGAVELRNANRVCPTACINKFRKPYICPHLVSGACSRWR